MINYQNFKELDAAGTYLVRLLFSVLHDIPAPVLPSDLNWDYIFYLAKIHCVEVMAFYGAEKYIKENADLYSTWKRCRDANLAQNVLQIEARAETFHSLYKSGIRFLPLKGFELKQLYNRPEFRQMSDIDILIDPENAALIQPLMSSLGYKCVKNIGSYEEYVKPPCITVEFHKLLFSTDKLKFEYYKKLWEKAVPDEENPGALKLSPEDFYIFQMVHLWKHFIGLGSGVRSIMDIYVYMKKFQDSMDWNYIRQELKKLELDDFSGKMESLSQYWFGNPDAQKNITVDGISELQRNIFFSGVYGSRESKKLKEMDSLQTQNGARQKIKYIRKRIFAGRRELEYSYPILKRIPVLLPFCWIHRLGIAVRNKKSIVKQELQLLLSKSKDR